MSRIQAIDVLRAREQRTRQGSAYYAEFGLTEVSCKLARRSHYAQMAADRLEGAL